MSERRQSLRFDKVFAVILTTPEGVSRGIARNISEQGLYVETRAPIPLGSRLWATLSGEDGTEMTCECEVRYQVALSYAQPGEIDGHVRGMGLRVVAYVADEAHTGQVH